MTQTAAVQTGPATARLSHLFYCPIESGTKEATPRHGTVTNASVSVDTIYDLRLVQHKKKKVREARRFLRLYLEKMKKKNSAGRSTKTFF